VTDRQRLIELALKGLESERARISEEIKQLQLELRGSAPSSEPRSTAPSRTSPNKGRTMSASQKRKISAALRRKWAERRGRQQGSSSGAQTQTRAISPNKGKTMTAAQKRKISEALRKRWAERKQKSV
jgi:hypothetical protein